MAPPARFTEALAVGPQLGDTPVDGASIRHGLWPSDGGETAAPIVLVHGGAAHLRWWDFTAPLLAQGPSGRDVLALDLSGHGHSDHRPAYRMEIWADEIAAVLDDRVAGRPAILVGHSLGGLVATVTAARLPDKVRGLVVVDSNIRPPEMEQEPGRNRVFAFSRTYRSRDEAIAKFALIPRQPCANEWALRHVAAGSVRPEGDRWGWHFDPRFAAWTSDRPVGAYAADLDVPTAVIRAEHSAIMPAVAVDSLRSLTGQPVPAVTIGHAHHHLVLDQPGAFVAALRTVVAYLDPSG